MNPLDERRKQDLAKIIKLGERARGRIIVSDVKGTPLDEAVITLNYKTAPSPRYPQETRDTTRIRVVLGSRYPFHEPAVEALDPVFNPNVYASGRVCIGTRWLPTEGLDLLITRIAKILTFDSEILNDRAPANLEAAHWYTATKDSFPDAFPSDKFELDPEVVQKKLLAWNNVKSNDASQENCPACSAKLRRYESGTIRCPECELAFEASR